MSNHLKRHPDFQPKPIEGFENVSWITESSEPSKDKWIHKATGWEVSDHKHNPRNHFEQSHSFTASHPESGGTPLRVEVTRPRKGTEAMWSVLPSLANDYSTSSFDDSWRKHKNSYGPAKMRGLMKVMKSLIPEAETLSGMRVTGAKSILHGGRPDQEQEGLFMRKLDKLREDIEAIDRMEV